MPLKDIHILHMETLYECIQRPPLSEEARAILSTLTWGFLAEALKQNLLERPVTRGMQHFAAIHSAVRHSANSKGGECGNMKDDNQLGKTVRRHRAAAGLTQQSLAQKLGVEASHVAFIENGHRKPSLKLIGRLADLLGVERQKLLVLAHPEAKGLIADVKPEKARNSSPSWQRFINNHELLARYCVTDRELRTLEQLGMLGSVLSTKEYLTILTLIRDIPSNK
jgi:transcriptional regulator with XRE-family HTH domain